MTPDERNILRWARSAPTERLVDRAELIGYVKPIRAEATMRQRWVEMAVLAELFRRGAIEQIGDAGQLFVNEIRFTNTTNTKFTK